MPSDEKDRPGLHAETVNSDSFDSEVAPSLAPPTPEQQPQQDEALCYFREFYDDVAGGFIWLATNTQNTDPESGRWHDAGPFGAGRGVFADEDHAKVLDSLASSAVATATQRDADVYACPYPLGISSRKKGTSVVRRYIHADIDGPTNLVRVRGLGAFAVASGSSTEDTPHAHVYVRLSRSVSAEEQRALCKGLGHHVGGRHADTSKVNDNDVLRVPGTLNHKTTPPRPVFWLVHPDDARTWEPEELARELGVSLETDRGEPDVIEHPSASPPLHVEAPDTGEDAETVTRRVESLIESVRAAKRRTGNDALNKAAWRAGGLHARYGEGAVPAKRTRAALVEAFVQREPEEADRRRREGCATVKSGWTSGVNTPDAVPDHSWSLVPEETGPDSSDIRSRFPVLDLAALVDPDRPPRRWLWGDVVPEGEQVSFVAPAGEGKSLLTLYLAVCAARGDRNFIGRPLQLPGSKRVLYIDMENSEDDFAERLPDLGVTPDNAPSLQERLLVFHLPKLRGLDTEQGASELRELLDEYSTGAGDLLILDSTQRVTEGEENSNDTMRRLYQLTSSALKRRGLTVIRTDNTGHTGENDKGRRARGASAKRDDVGMAWTLEWQNRKECLANPDVQRQYTLENTKRRVGTGESSNFITFRHVRNEAGHLVFEPQAVSNTKTQLRAFLEKLGIPPEQGHRSAYETAKAEQDRALAVGEPAPDKITARLVGEVQNERRATEDLASEADDK